VYVFIYVFYSFHCVEERLGSVYVFKCVLYSFRHVEERTQRSGRSRKLVNNRIDLLR